MKRRQPRDPATGRAILGGSARRPIHAYIPVRTPHGEVAHLLLMSGPSAPRRTLCNQIHVERCEIVTEPRLPICANCLALLT